MTKIIPDLSNSEYHSSPAISKSGLDEFDKSPAHYYAKYLSEDKPEVVWTDAFTIGAAVHSLVLEPEKFEQEFAVKPADLRKPSEAQINAKKRTDKTTKQIEDWDKFQLEAEEKIILSQPQLKLCNNMNDAVQNHSVASKYLDGFGKAETSIFFELDDVACRCRPDYITEDGIIVDLKTAQTAHPFLWPKKAFDFRYHVQTAFYSEGYYRAFGEMPKAFVFVVVEKTEPYSVTVFKADDGFYTAGMVDTLNNIREFKICQQNNEWPGYAEGKEVELSLPNWAAQQYLKESA